MTEVIATVSVTSAIEAETPYPEYTDHWVMVRGCRVHYLRAQTVANTPTPAPPLILLHGGGLGSAALTYAKSIGSLAARAQVFAPDWPGYAGSDKPNVPYTTAWYIAFLADYLDVLGIAQADLCGLSMGGAIALGFALAYPRRVRRIVLVNSHGLGQPVPCRVLSNLAVHLPWLNTLGWWGLRHCASVMRCSLRPALHYPEAITDALVAEACEIVQDRGTVRAWARWQRSEIGWRGFRTDYRAQLPSLRAPTLILHSARDRVVPVRYAAQAYRRIPNCRLRVFPHCGHWLMRDDPDAFAHALTEFLAPPSAGDAVSSTHDNPDAFAV